MKKGLLVVVASLMLVAAPAMLCAQSFLPAGLPGFGTGMGSSSSCTPAGKPFLDPLSFYVGWGDTTPGYVTFSYDAWDPSHTVNGLTHKWAARGVWLGLAEKANFSNTSAIAVEAWLLLPTTGTGSEGYMNGITFQVPGGLQWDAKPDWWFIDGRLLYTPLSTNSSVFAGFRYDHFSTRFERASGVFGPVILGQGDVTVNSYIPYIGLEYNSRGSGNSNYLVRVLGFPWVPADVTHYQTVLPASRLESTGNFSSMGYFFEVFGEYNWTFFGGSSMGAFLRWNTLSGRGNIFETLKPGGLTASDTFSFNRNHITIGGKVALDFALPW
jgi:hypothetical protein